jgi:RHS repeat-associated protein
MSWDRRSLWRIVRQPYGLPTPTRPFGTTSVSGATDANPYQFTGRESDGTGLYYYRARYYHPQLQRFVSEDPLGLVGGDVNLYAYVKNSPTNFADPLGLLQFSSFGSFQLGELQPRRFYAAAWKGTSGTD